jgi:ribosome biogenesis GTPase / thiamine phosphate phosphatase
VARAAVPCARAVEVSVVPSLAPLGWGPFFSSQLSLEESSSLVPGRAVADRGPRLLVRFADADRLVVVPGRLRAAGEVPVVGDFVLARAADGVSDPVVERVLARRSRLSRNAAGRETAEQVLAANVDVVFVVQGLDEGPNPRRLERTLAAVHAGGAEPVIVLTKPDLADPASSGLRRPFPAEQSSAGSHPALAVALAAARGAAPGIEAFVASGLTGEGVATLAALLAPGLTGVFTGPSGAGKSTLVNALLGGVVQATAEVRAADARGRHTTTGRTLFPLPGGGAVIDGPGIRELQLWDAGGLDAAFEDVAALAARCRFSDCSHAGEPGCAVFEAVEAGSLEAARLESHRKLARELDRQALRRDGGAARAERARWRPIHKERRRQKKERGR